MIKLASQKIFNRRAAQAILPPLLVAVVLAAAFLAPSRSSLNSILVCSGYGVGCTAPTVTNVNPSTGTAVGGITVTITGTQFNNSGLVVHFGASLATNVVIVSDTQITVTTPAHAVGSVDVTVTTASGTSAPSLGDVYTFTQPACTSAGLSSDKASPQIIGVMITFTATSTGCANPEYQFYLQSPTGAWTLMQAYDGTVWVWDTSTFAPGNYVVNVWVTQIGSGVAVMANHLMNFTITGPVACSGAGLTSDKASPQQIDFTITFTATSTGCLNPLYLFYLQSPGGGWTIVQGYGGPVFVWDTTGLASIGNYVVNVWVTNAGSGVAVQTNHLLPFTITNRVCSAAGMTSSKASPQVHGVSITFTATSAGCARPLYLFYLKGPGLNGTWSVAQTYDGTTWTWDTSGVASIGTYEVNVWVTANGSGQAVQTNFVIFFTLT